MAQRLFTLRDLFTADVGAFHTPLARYLPPSFRLLNFLSAQILLYY